MRPLLALSIVLLPAGVSAAGAPTGTLSADAVFAADVLSLQARGYRLAELGAEWTQIDEDHARVTMTVVLAKGDRAERLSIGFGEYGENPESYERGPVRAPDERRHYAMEPELYAVLRGEGPFTLVENCGGDYYLGGPQGGVSLGLNDYYVVTGRAAGTAAQERLAAEIASALGAGMDLANVTRNGAGEVQIVLVDGEGEGTILIASVDDKGTVSSLEVRAARQVQAWEALRDGKALGRALRETGVLRTIRADPESGRIHLDLGKKRRFTVDPGHTFPRTGEWDHEGDCGC